MVHDFIKDKNSKCIIRNSTVMRVKKYYLSMYRAYMVYLYDSGYISDPTLFDKKEITKNVLEFGIKDLTNSSGVINLVSSQADFAFRRLEEGADEDVKRFLYLLKNTLKYREIYMNIDRFYNDNKFQETPKPKVSLSMSQSASRIFSKVAYDHDVGVLDCFLDRLDSVEFISFNDFIYDLALKELDLSDIKGEGSLFVKGLSTEDEVFFADLILNGTVILDGKYAKVLEGWLKNNKWSTNNKFSHEKEGLYNKIVKFKTDDMMTYQNEMLEKYQSQGYNVVYIRSDGLYYETSKTEIEYPIGVFCVSSTDDEDIILDSINLLGGYTGEVKPLSYLEESDLSFVGCPIELYRNGKLEKFVDIEQTEFSSTSSWFSFSGSNLIFNDRSSYYGGLFEDGSLKDRLFRLIGESEAGNFICKSAIIEEGKELETAKKEVIKKLNY